MRFAEYNYLIYIFTAYITQMNSHEIRQKFLDFFKNAPRNHVIIPSASLVPENDPTVLFNTAGMQPLVPYLMGNPHPAGERIADVQKCLRTTDIEDIGDNTHATFFEMLGNWSLGNYFKEEAIKWSYEFLFDKEYGLGLNVSRLYVTVFEGDENAPKDLESFEIWKKLGIPTHRIYFKGAQANWWPAVKGKDTWTGPTGPCSEMFYDISKEGLGDLTPEEYEKADEEQKIVEIWNDVFMQYEKQNGKIIGKLKKNNVDTGAGLERLSAILQNKASIFETDLFSEIMSIARTLCADSSERNARVISDHIRSAVFLIGDGVEPSNTDQGYILRRLLRRAIFKTKNKNINEVEVVRLVKAVISTYEGFYTEIENRQEIIVKVITEESQRFSKTLERGLKEFEKVYSQNKDISGEQAFSLFSTYGFPVELTLELAKDKGLTLDKANFDRLWNEHQTLSRTGSNKKFKGGLADTSEISLRYHTATHLLHQALREVLGTKVEQKGSNITPERLRFDFSFERKMTDEEKQRVENIVNQKIQAGLQVNKVLLPKAEAIQTGALHFFGEKYADTVSVYYIGKDLESAYSKEFCGGPHVKSTGEIGIFRILKEEAVSAGVRRIKAVVS